MSIIVSVIIPTYGGAKFLERCVDSVLAQSFKEIEVIVVDDNGVGTENQVKTAMVMSKYSKNDKVHYICHPVNKNGSAARNTGVKQAKGDYITVFDDDDEMYSNFVDEHMKVLPKLPEDYALTYCGFDLFNDKGEKITVHQATLSGQDLYSILLHKVEIGSSTMLIRKNVYLGLNGFDETFKRHQDWEFTARVMARYKVKALSFIGYARYLENRNTPKNTKTAIEYRKYYLKKMAPYISKLPKRKRRDVVVYNLLGASLGYLFDEKNYKMFIVEFFRVHPGYRGLFFLVKSFRNRVRTLLKGIFKV